VSKIKLIEQRCTRCNVEGMVYDSEAKHATAAIIGAWIPCPECQGTKWAVIRREREIEG
jgi:hypothetical protein